MDSSSSSGSGGVVFAMLTGATTPSPQVVASFQFGGNGVPSSGQYEYRVSAGSPRQAGGRVDALPRPRTPDKTAAVPSSASRRCDCRSVPKRCNGRLGPTSNT